MLIGLVGKKSSGKDTLANFLKENRDFISYAYAEPLKETCRTLFLLTDKQLCDPKEKEALDPRWNKSPRQLFQFIGTDVMRNQFDVDFWVNYFRNWYVENKSRNVVVTDCRFQNEVDAVIQSGGVIIKIVRNTGFSDDHISESGIDNLTGISHTCNNNGSLEDFYHNISIILGIIEGK